MFKSTKELSMTMMQRTAVVMVVGLALISSGLWAQDVMRITRKDNSVIDIPVSEIESVTFTQGAQTVPSDALQDADGNVYKTVRIGDQVWMAENLRTSKYMDGTPIPEVKENKAWSEASAGAFCWYKDDSATYDQLYGKLYNWQAVNSGKIAPPGWRVPTDEDWDLLVKTLGGDKEAGAKMKVTGKVHWQNNDKSTNESGFSAYSGYRTNLGSYSSIGLKALFWSGTQNFSYSNQAWARELVHNSTGVTRLSLTKTHGCFIRFIKE